MTDDTTPLMRAADAQAEAEYQALLAEAYAEVGLDDADVLPVTPRAEVVPVVVLIVCWNGR